MSDKQQGAELAEARKAMSMMAYLSTDGGRRCPLCGRFAKPSELGDLSFSVPGGRVSVYGHLPGFGCNQPETAK